MLGLPGSSVVKNLPTNPGDMDLTGSLFTEQLKSMSHNYCACALEPGSLNYEAHILQLLKLTHPRARAPQREKPLQWEAQELQLENSPHMVQPEKSLQSNKDPVRSKINTFKKHLWCD